MYFHVRSILHGLGTPLPYEDGFSKVKNRYINSAYYVICNDYDVDADETWIHGDGFIRQAMQYAPLGQKLQKGFLCTM